MAVALLAAGLTAAPALSRLSDEVVGFTRLAEGQIAMGYGDNHVGQLGWNWYYCDAASIFVYNGGAVGATLVVATPAPRDILSAPTGSPGLCAPPFPPQGQARTWQEVVMDPTLVPGAVACVAAQVLIPPPSGSPPPPFGMSGGILCSDSQAVRLRGNGVLSSRSNAVYGFGPTFVEFVP